MTTIKIFNNTFEVDVEKTIEYYKTHSFCECDFCNNYSKLIKGRLPETESILSQFGIDISRPDELEWGAVDNVATYYCICYTVCGKAVSIIEDEIVIQDSQSVELAFTNGFVSPNEQESDYFTITILNNVKLPLPNKNSTKQSSTSKLSPRQLMRLFRKR